MEYVRAQILKTPVYWLFCSRRTRALTFEKLLQACNTRTRPLSISLFYQSHCWRLFSKVLFIWVRENRGPSIYIVNILFTRRRATRRALARGRRRGPSNSCCLPSYIIFFFGDYFWQASGPLFHAVCRHLFDILSSLKKYASFLKIVAAAWVFFFLEIRIVPNNCGPRLGLFFLWILLCEFPEEIRVFPNDCGRRLGLYSQKSLHILFFAVCRHLYDTLRSQKK